MSDFTIKVRDAGPLRLGGALSAMRPGRRFVLLLAGLLLGPGCSSNTPTVPTGGITRAVIGVTVTPNPVTGTLNPVTTAVTATYTITITETAGLGGTVDFVSSTVYNPSTGTQVALTYYDSSDLVVYVGSKRIEAKGTLVVPQTVTYTLPDATVPANLSISVQLTDDRQNLVHESVLVKIQ